jgi:predicted GTPase
MEISTKLQAANVVLALIDKNIERGDADFKKQEYLFKTRHEVILKINNLEAEEKLNELKK